VAFLSLKITRELLHRRRSLKGRDDVVAIELGATVVADQLPAGPLDRFRRIALPM
jgi:hypothetical protein